VHPLLEPLYAGAGGLAEALAAVAPLGDHKILRSLRARRRLLDRFRAWGTAGRETARPLLWVHAPSVGEGLQARPLVHLVRAQEPRVQIAYTHFSPSAERFAAELGVDFADYLPFDTARAARDALDALRPTALVFCKLDVWPNLVRSASARGVKLGLVSGTLPESSQRLGRFGRALLADAYGALDAVGAIDDADARRLVALGVRGSVVRVTGDTRYDQVWERAGRVDRSSPLLAPLANGRPTVVAGSTWPPDEAVLLPALGRARASAPRLRVIIAAHEPTPSHLQPIESWARRTGMSHARLGTPAAPDADIVVVDRVGVLGELYALADIAFVGGGFHDAGLHSVLEPAAFGVPVLFGPRTRGSRDADRLIAGGGGAMVTGPADLAARLAGWLDQPAVRADAGARARGVVSGGLGAARASYELVRGLLASGS
jgi:3-deoxy-D-manno-octulosonic-acid transferase